MKKLLLVLNDMPYKTDRNYNALRAAGTAADNGTEVVIFLMGDSVYVVRKGQRPPAGFPNLEEMVLDLINKGVEFKLCGTCVNSRGFEPKDGEVSSCFTGSKSDGGLSSADFISGAGMSNMVEFINLVDSSDKVIGF